MEDSAKRFLFAVSVLAFSLAVPKSQASILPPNDLHFQDSFVDSNITEEQFNQITELMAAPWRKLAEIHGAQLVVQKDWTDSTVNAFASRDGNKWIIQMYGGLARRPEITPDGYALVVCHELGHHFGGYVFKGSHWASAEGQADYFATQVCARRVWGKSTETNARLARKGRLRMQHACDDLWANEDERNLCYRVTEAGLSLAKLLGALAGDKPPSLETRDQTEVARTQTSHPRAQCRLDTYLHGALCPERFNLRVIPKDEPEAGRYSCMQSANYRVGYRPRCWFKEERGQSVDELLAAGWSS